MRKWDHFLAVDWSGAKGERHKGIALAIAEADGGPPVLVDPPRGGFSRVDVLEILRDDLPANTLVGIDLGISLPFNDAGAFFPGWDRSPSHAKKLWALIDEICEDDPHLGANSCVTHPEARRYFRHSRNDEGDRFHLDDAPSREGRFREAEIAQLLGVLLSMDSAPSPVLLLHPSGPVGTARSGMILAEVEDLQLGQHEQQRPTAEAPQQHARVPRLMMAPMPSLEDLQQYGHK